MRSRKIMLEKFTPGHKMEVVNKEQLQHLSRIFIPSESDINMFKWGLTVDALVRTIRGTWRLCLKHAHELNTNSFGGNRLHWLLCTSAGMNGLRSAKNLTVKPLLGEKS